MTTRLLKIKKRDLAVKHELVGIPEF